MNEKVKDWIKKSLEREEYELTLHARIRMKERLITERDIANCGRTLKNIRSQSANRYRISGCDFDGEPLVIVCAIDVKVVIITVF